MIYPKIHAKGLKDVINKCDRLARHVAETMEEAIEVTGKEIAAEAKAAAPKDQGTYRRRIRSRFIRRKWAGYSSAKIASFNGSRPSPLGHLLEFGHRAVDPTKTTASTFTDIRSGGKYSLSLVPRAFKKGKLKGMFRRTDTFVPGKPHLIPAYERGKARLIARLKGLMKL
jgi:HK97 gp10 family phage protein